ncbi:hypothetical protein CRI77_15275 [Mycolicibacterium duvalii]|uniref:Uncharacterized protein n=1 Tax=Mycolicibacterium duvalii TaxID=39688 RepID=A0A7I7K3R1_9MYCO|nr:hypothetical protein [Mycolicibacterium duvalii]MCV7370606.1 hypothetical protein [Mycolicibacterium duvalii]PEG39893.1 hypothetical protein CRI77_15275 [Mycolicibacterium duvalii]BBX18012.1 hypothetical protein MDUV_28720 [Mycolicibacterium duvalii]
MNAIKTKLQVTAAAAAIAAGAAFAPGAAHAAPAVQAPAAPVQQVAGGVSEAPGDLLFYSRVISLQIAAANIRFRSFILESRAERLQAYADRYPGTAFGEWAAAAAQRTLERRAAYGQLSFSACRGDSGIQVGPYGTVTRSCVTSTT